MGIYVFVIKKVENSEFSTFLTVNSIYILDKGLIPHLSVIKLKLIVTRLINI